MFKRVAIILAITCGSSLATSAQSLLEAHPECGNPRAYSDSYDIEPSLTGLHVAEVVDGRTLKVVTHTGDLLLVRIAGVSVDDFDNVQQARSADYLAELVDDRNVLLLLLGHADESVEHLKELEAHVIVGDLSGRDVGYMMIEAGMANYGDSRHLDGYNRCAYRSAVRAAQVARRGLWDRALR